MDGFFCLSSFQEFPLEAFGILGGQPERGFKNARLMFATRVFEVQAITA